MSIVESQERDTDTDTQGASKQQKQADRFCTSLVDIKNSGGICLYKVLWNKRGKGAVEVTWEPAGKISPELIARFHRDEVHACALTTPDMNMHTISCIWLGNR